MSLFIKSTRDNRDANWGALISHNPECSGMSYSEENSASLSFAFTSSLSCNVGNGIRVAMEVHNEIRLLCLGIKDIAKLHEPAPLKIEYTNWHTARKLSFLHVDGSSYCITCKRVVIESHEQYCIDTAGKQIPVGQTMELYKDSGQQIREWLNELAAKRRKSNG